MSKPEKVALTADEHQAFLSFIFMNRFGHIKSETKQDEKPVVEVSGGRNFFDPEQKMEEDTIVGIGSITKSFTAATLLKLWDEELTATKTAQERGEVVDENKLWFPQGMNTPLNRFMDGLKKKFPKEEFSKLAEVFAIIEKDEHYKKGEITLEHLLNHTHGLGARNDQKANRLVLETGDRPLTLAEIASVTEKREKEEFGKHLYGNFSFDLAAMIIEVVTGQEFDEVVKEKVLKPNQLNDTHPQSDIKGLYQNNSDGRVARGYAASSKKYIGDNAGTNLPYYSEIKFNEKSNTRAAGGFKSTVADLTKFAPLFYGAKMFENDEVKGLINNHSLGVDRENGIRYHLGMLNYQDGTVGHSGDDFVFQSNLAYNPNTKEVSADLWTYEAVSQQILRETFTAAYPKESEVLNSFIGSTIYVPENFRSGDEFFAQGAEQKFNDLINAQPNRDEIMVAMKTLQELHARISEKYPTPQAWAENMGGIIAEFSKPMEEKSKNPLLTEAIVPGDQELTEQFKMPNHKTFFLVGPNIKHISELQEAKEELTESGQLQVFMITSKESYDEAIREIQSYGQANPETKIRIVTDAHGVEQRGEDGISSGTGQLEFGSKNSPCEVFPAEIAKALENCNVEFIDNSACCIGTGIASKENQNLELYQDIPPNIPIILNGGKRKAITSLLQPEIIKTLEIDAENPALTNFLNKVFHPNTLKILMKKEDGQLVIHKISAPKPKSPADVTPEAIELHLRQEIDKAVDWWHDNVDSSIGRESLKEDFAKRINPQLIEEYRGRALIMETHRKKADYVKYYVEAGTDPNQSISDGTTALGMSCGNVEMMSYLLKSPTIDVNNLDNDGISLLCVASYAKNNKEAVDLLLNHPSFNQTLEDFNAARESLKNNYLKSQPEYYEMNNPLVNYVRAELSFREGKMEDAKMYMGLAIEGESMNESRKQEYQDRLQVYQGKQEAVKFPENPEIVAMVSSDSKENRDQQFPILSVSKTFCGAVCALMAVDGKFGDRGLNANLWEVLKKAKSDYPDRADEIDKLLGMLKEKGMSGITLVQLLTHTSGADNTKLYEGYKPHHENRTITDFLQEHLIRKDSDKHNYSNDGYVLVHQLINLVSDSGSYEKELQARILGKCGMVNTHNIYKTPEAIEAMARVGKMILLPGARKLDGTVVAADSAEEYNPLEHIIYGKIPLATGGLCSTVNDMERFGVQLGKMIMGQDNDLADEAKTKAIQEMYRSARLDNGYSLGVFIQTNEETKETVIQHGGGFPGNQSRIKITMSEASEPEVSFWATKENYLANFGLLYQVQFAPISEYLDKLLDKEKGNFSGPEKFAVLDEKQSYLIKQGKLSKEFPELRKGVYEGFEKAAKEILKSYIGKDGLIDEATLRANFDEVRESVVNQGTKNAEAIFAKSEELLKQEKQTTKSTPSSSPEGQSIAVTNLKTGAEAERKESFVEMMNRVKDGDDKAWINKGCGRD